MTKFQIKIALATSIIAIIGFAIWLYFDPDFEPAIALILGFGSLLGYLQFDKKFKNKRLKGKVKFDYSNNNGCYIIGIGELEFETQWSKASKQSIHLYNDPSIISGISLAKDFHMIDEIKNADQFDFSSRSRTIQKH